MKRLAAASAGRAREWLCAPAGNDFGIAGFRCWKFWAVLAFYLGGFLLLVRDPFFLRGGAFSYQQGMVTLLLAFVIVAAICWVMMLFGPPRGANLLLQFMMCLPAFLFVARITAAPSMPPADVGVISLTVDGIGKFRQWLGIGRLLEYIPFWIRDLFANWQVTLFFMVVMGALSFRRTGVRLSLLVLLLAIEFFAVFAGRGSAPDWLLGGTICLLAGMGLQFCRCDRIVYYENVVDRLSAAPCDESALRAILRIAAQGREDGRVSEEGVRRIVKSEYGSLGNFSAAEFGCIASELTGRILYEYRIMHLSGGADGVFLIPAPNLCRCETLLGGLSVWPRVIFTLLAAVVWVLLPVDLIPDSIPFDGALDDVTVTILSGIVLRNAMENSR